jgi:predicted metal-dependent peptidase
MTEVKGVLDTVTPEMVDVIYWDDGVAGHEVYDNVSFDQIVNVTKPIGGGGTCVGAVREYMEAKDIKPDCVIIFTDGFVERDWGGDNWPCPLLWCVTTKGRMAPTGKTLHIPAA